LFTTGYLFTSRKELERLAEPIDGDTAAAFIEFTRSRNCTVYGGIPERDGDRVFNSALLVSKGKLESVYRKLHLFKAEKQIFDRAEGPPPVVRAQDAELGLMICFDWVFPEMARTLALDGAQVLLLCANLVLPYCQHAMITRSIENGVFTLLANRVGTEDRGGKSLTFTGGSEIVDHRGRVLARASADRAEIIQAEFNPADAEDKMITPENHLFDDRRTPFYRLGDRQA
jgi:predicted amidohydrolase